MPYRAIDITGLINGLSLFRLQRQLPKPIVIYFIVSETFRDIFQSKSKWIQIFLVKKAFGNIVWEMSAISFQPLCINTLRPRQNGRHFADDTFQYIFLNENFGKNSLKFVPKGPINNIPALVQIMAWCDQATSHYLNQWWLDYRRIYASLGLNELRSFWATNVNVYSFFSMHRLATRNDALACTSDCPICLSRTSYCWQGHHQRSYGVTSGPKWVTVDDMMTVDKFSQLPSFLLQRVITKGCTRGQLCFILLRHGRLFWGNLINLIRFDRNKIREFLII